MRDLYFELFYFCARFVGHTNKNIPIIFIVSFGIIGIIVLSVLKNLTNDNPILEKLRDMLVIAVVMLGVIFIGLSATQTYPKGIKVTTQVGNYREITTKQYSLNEYVKHKQTTLTSEKVINYRLTYADNDEDLFKSEFYVYKKTEEYEKAPNLSKYPKKYHKKTLIKVFIRPVKVTTDWRGIKESYDLYEVKEVYKVEPNIVQYEDDKVFQK